MGSPSPFRFHTSLGPCPARACTSLDAGGAAEGRDPDRGPSTVGLPPPIPSAPNSHVNRTSLLSMGCRF